MTGRRPELTLMAIRRSAEGIALLVAAAAGFLLGVVVLQGGLWPVGALAAVALAPPALLISRRITSPGSGRLPELEAARRQQEALSVVFHELRRPLSTLVSAAEMALDTSLAEEERGQLLTSVHRQALRLGGYLEELLEAARIQSGGPRLNPRPMDLRPVVKEACREFAEAHPSHDLRLKTGRRPLPVAADPKLRMVLNNLLANAAAYSPPGATITVRLSHDDATVRVQVDDQGPGVPEPYRQQIFEQFFRVPGTPQRGFGLGLYIARQLVLAHGGSIWVEGREGRGSRFIVALPALRGHAAVSPSRGRAASSPTDARPRRAAPGRRVPPSRPRTGELPPENAR